MKKYILPIAALCLASFALDAQNVNQTIQVTNDYRTSAPEANKKSLDLKVADSLYSFDYRFDYSVFDTPYQGSYEFSPYAVMLDTRQKEKYLNRFFLSAGAGYSFHPELELDWEMRPADNVSLSVFANGDGYYGCYKVLDSKLARTGNSADGFDFSDNAGINANIRTYSSVLGFELGHNGIFAADRIAGSGYNSFYAKASAKSIKNAVSFFFYDLSLAYSYGMDNIYYSSLNQALLAEHNAVISGTVGPVLDNRYRFLVDLYAEYDNMPSRQQYSTLVKVTPRVEFQLGRSLLSAGVKFFFDPQNTFTLAPDIRFNASFYSNRLDVGAYIGGDSKMNSHSALKRQYHFFVPAMLPCSEEIQITSERLNAGLFAGLNFRNFKMRLGGGWAYVQNDLAQSFTLNAGRAFDCFVLADYQMLKADLNFDWFSEKLRASMDLKLRHAFSYKNNSEPVFAPSLLSGGLDVKYAFNKRIHAGLNLEAATGRRQRPGVEVLEIPAWICPGLSADYVLNDKWTFWAKAGNLAGMSPRYDLTHIQSGPYLTLGARFIL